MNMIWNEQGFFEISPKPNSNELKEYYNDNYTGKKLQNGREYTTDEIYNKYLGCMEAEYILNGAKGSFIDIGCGEGFYLDHFSKLGWSVLGADFSKDGITKHFPSLTDKVIQGDVFETIDNLIKRGDKFDFITLNHVLEHVIDPNALIKKIKLLASKKCVFKISVPNDFSLIQTYLKENNYIERDYWVCTPDHLNYFNTEGLVKFLIHNDFRIIDTLAEFPIELFLFNDHSNYQKLPETGRSAHYSRVHFENMLAKDSIQKLISFRRGCANSGIGRVVSAYCSLVHD
ncbi:class I SAM-dependent methyltransferase [Bacteriovorax sp. Seq25_V]|uniref:class I SAM-dependent methyltransferase n=1 Tax=Bacteriovorax sp. Seq25_V TaxID=1201288 RepID=UPI00054E2796|nr:class I SAM-dependent methyltransferase [Bacteriovorax sp. Seq25_V]